MTRAEEIRNKSYELGQKYFPDVNNVWARANIEAQYVSNACMEIVQWADNTMIEKACDWLYNKALDGFYNEDGTKVLLADGIKQKFIESFKKAMEL